VTKAKDTEAGRPRVGRLSELLRGPPATEYARAWEILELRDLILELLKRDAQGIDPIVPIARKNRERELAAIRHWFTSPMKRKAAEGRRAIFKAAWEIRERDPRTPLSQLVDHPDLIALRKRDGRTGFELDESTVRKYLVKMGFGTNRPGRPKKTL
jgi:hypothetical protein